MQAQFSQIEVAGPLFYAKEKGRAMIGNGDTIQQNQFVGMNHLLFQFLQSLAQDHDFGVIDEFAKPELIVLPINDFQFGLHLRNYLTVSLACHLRKAKSRWWQRNGRRKPACIPSTLQMTISRN